LGQDGISTDIVLLGLHISGVRSLSRRINFLGTCYDCRISGKPLAVLRIFIWCIIVTVFLLILSLPVLAVGVTILLTDRNLNSNFFDSKKGGNVIIFQHLF
jgi:cytochrome c oxidase subunit 1